jgi:1-phosphofructokinase
MSDHAMVFEPTPRLTVTVEQFGDGDADLHVHAGGQGIWEARMLALLGVPVTVCAVVGGEIGPIVEQLVVAEGVSLQAVGRQADNGWYVHDRRSGHRTEIAESLGVPLNRHEIDELYGLALAEGLRAAVTVLSGPSSPSVVPADVYRRLAGDLSANGARVVADLSGEHLDAALAGGLAFVKVSHEEVVECGRAGDDSADALVSALLELHADGAHAAMISRAAEPALALLDGEVYEVEVPPLQTTDPRGAGDSMTAGVAAVLARGGDLHEAVRTGAAAGALNVTRHGLGTGRADVIAALTSRVRLEPLAT